MMMMGWWKDGDGGAFHRRIMCFMLMLGLSFFTGVESTTTSSLSSLLMQHSNNLCFVNQYPMCNNNRRRSNPFLSSSSSPRKFAPFLDNSAKTSKRAFQQQRGSIIMRGNNNPNNNNNNSNTTNNQQQQQQLVLPTILMYTLVPFLPSITIQSLNDHYQQLKQQFNLAAAALPPSPSSSTTGATTAAVKDSIEYITASNLYNESMHSLLILLLSKRVALYFMATMATVYAGWRASLTMGVIERGDGSWLSGPGMALDYLNREVLKGETSALLYGRSGGGSSAAGATEELDSDLEKEEEEEEDDKLFATLVDDSPQSTKVGSTIALILPLVLGGSLAFSYSLISFFKDSGSGGVDGSSTFSSFIDDEYLSAIQGLLPYLTSIPSMVLCVLFVATEFRSVSSSSSTSTNTSSSLLLRAENIAALLYVLGAYIAKVYPTITIGGEWNLDLGPLQNGVNIAFAATVVRALSPFLISYTSTTLDPSSSTSKQSPISIRTMALALVGVTMFDGISVFGTVANAATTVDTTTTTTSVMETVATYKADAQLWNPGLLSVIVGHNQNAKITEALGLGDVVFPACLVAWGFFADAIGTPIKEAVEEEVGEETTKRQISYTTAAIAGYVIGSAATEIVGSFSLLGSGRGLPALIFLIPSMLIAVTAVAASRGELNEVWGSSGVAESNASD